MVAKRKYTKKKTPNIKKEAVEAKNAIVELLEETIDVVEDPKSAEERAEFVEAAKDAAEEIGDVAEIVTDKIGEAVDKMVDWWNTTGSKMLRKGASDYRIMVMACRHAGVEKRPLLDRKKTVEAQVKAL